MPILYWWGKWGSKKISKVKVSQDSNSCLSDSKAKSLQLCLTLCDPMDRNPPGSSVHRILQARTLDWVAISFCKSRCSFLKNNICFWHCWVFLAANMFSLVVGLLTVAASPVGSTCSRLCRRRHSWPLGPGRVAPGSVLVAAGHSCLAARGIFPDQGSNPDLLHWQVDSLPLSHYGSPLFFFLMFLIWIHFLKLKYNCFTSLY